jgi:hypothetical protein
MISLEQSALPVDPPTEVLRTVAPSSTVEEASTGVDGASRPRESNDTRALRIRRPNAELRTREHLTPGEVNALIEAAKANRYGPM